ncbi:MAG: ABC transporter permease, partial [Candidatus Aminicenantes bacterium]|nr:ABC transporter permease [Candidatus Aminicenantes bacterium]
MSDSSLNPPRLAEKILGLICPDGGGFSPLGDFAEGYAEIAERRGRASADAWYAGQILKSIPGFLSTKFYWSIVMFRNYFVIYLRTLIRDRAASLINLAGLAVGIASFLLILTYVRFETGYDRFQENADRIFRVINVNKNSTGVRTADPLAAALKAEVPGIDRCVRIMPPWGKPVLQFEDKQFFQKGYFAENGFLDMFSFPVIGGNAAAALDGPAKIVLTKSLAEKYFGRQDPVGKTMIFKDIAKPRNLTVTAVLRDVPSDSHLQFEYLISLDTLRSDEDFAWMFGSYNVQNFPMYLELAPAASPESVEAGISAWMSRLEAQGSKSRPFSRSFRLQALPDIHLKSNFSSDYAETGDPRNVRLFMFIAVLVLLIACVNHINLATARSGLRAREIGIRKVNGAFRVQVFRQFLGESFTIMILAGLLALGLLALVLPWFDSVMGIPLRLSLAGKGGVLPWLAATIVLAALGAGLYPAAMLSSLSPVRTIRGSSDSKRGGSFMRNILVVSQFTASIALVAATLVILDQMRYVRSARLGYDREHVIVMTASEPETREKLPAIKTALEGRPEVVKASLTRGLPTAISQGWTGWEAVKEDGTKTSCDFTCDYVDENFLDVFGIGLAMGRNFRAGDKPAVLLNETAVRDFGWTDLAGKKVKFGDTDYRVIGIVKDFHFASLHKTISPMALIYEEGNMIAVRVRPGDLVNTLGVLRSVFEENSHGQPFDYFFLDDAFNALYRKETRSGKLFGAFSALAVLIACLGLFGLASFNIARRVREIGIRKVLGASIGRLVLLLNKDFLRLVL